MMLYRINLGNERHGRTAVGTEGHLIALDPVRFTAEFCALPVVIIMRIIDWIRCLAFFQTTEYDTELRK